MKILIVSDTHGRSANYEKVLKKVEPVDRIIHLGDIEEGLDYLPSLSQAPMDVVAGNCDGWFCNLPSDLMLELGKYKVFITHGHGYFVNRGYDDLAEEARKRKADIVMYGHTHTPCLVQEEGLTILNPGSLSRPRQSNGRPSYIIMELDREGQAHFTINYL